MEGFWSGDAPGNLYWAHVCRFCSQPAGQSGFRAPPDQNALRPKQGMWQTTVVTEAGTIKPRRLIQTERLLAIISTMLPQKPLGMWLNMTPRSNVWLAVWVFALKEQKQIKWWALNAKQHCLLAVTEQADLIGHGRPAAGNGRHPIWLDVRFRM